MWSWLAAMIAMGAGPNSEGEPWPRARVALLCVILPQDAPPISRSEVESITASVISERPSLELTPSDEAFSLGMDDPLRVCGSDLPCLARAVERLRANVGLIVIVDASGETTRLSLRSFDAAAGRELASSSLDLASRAELASSFRSASNELLDRMGHPIAARLQIRTYPPEARVRLEPSMIRPDDHLRRLQLPPGRYRVVAELEGHEPTSAEILLQPGRNEVVELSLEPRVGLVRSPWFWIAVGGAVMITSTVVLVSFATRDDVWCFSGANRSCPD